MIYENYKHICMSYTHAFSLCLIIPAGRRVVSFSLSFKGIMFVTSRSFYWFCCIMCPYLWINTHTKLSSNVLPLELHEVHFVLQSGHQESLSMLWSLFHYTVKSLRCFCLQCWPHLITFEKLIREHPFIPRLFL